MTRKLAYMMHPLGSGPKREQNRWLACQWQAKIQEAYPDYLVLAPWIGLSGAWTEDRRDDGMAVDFATIDVCEVGILTGPLDGPQDFVNVRTNKLYKGVSPGMSVELHYFEGNYPDKTILDVRSQFEVKLPAGWLLPHSMMTREPRAPLYAPGDRVIADGKPHGYSKVARHEERAPGVYYYLCHHIEEYWAHEQMLKRER